MLRTPFRRILAALSTPFVASAIGMTAEAVPVSANESAPTATALPAAASTGPVFVSEAGLPGLDARLIHVPDHRRAQHKHQSRARLHHRSLADGSPRTIGRVLAARNGWSGTQWSCLDHLWTRESHWQVNDENPSSGAYGIPQALPASKMASAGSDWQSNPLTQIRWGLTYVQTRYGSPCTAWSHFLDHNYY